MNPHLLSQIKEKTFQQQVIQLAELKGWKHYHTYNSKRSVAGFPDLLMIKENRIIIAELKSQKGKLSEAQKEWLMAFIDTEKVEVYTWRPSDWQKIQGVL